MLKFLVKLLLECGGRGGGWGGYKSHAEIPCETVVRGGGWGGGHKSHTEIVIVGRGGWGEATNPMLKYPVKLLSGGGGGGVLFTAS